MLLLRQTKLKVLQACIMHSLLKLNSFAPHEKTSGLFKVLLLTVSQKKYEICILVKPINVFKLVL